MTDETAAARREPAMPEETPLLRMVRAAVIGDDQVMDGPFGPRRVTYADYTASGRALDVIEDFVRDAVLPVYANTHTESSGTGLQTTRLREDARRIVGECVGADAGDAVIFTGSGATGAIAKLVGILGLRIPSVLEDAYRLSDSIPADQRPVVFVGPYEHHSNDLPWRESIADVVTIREDAGGHLDLAHLEEELIRYADRPLRIGSFSAASNVTGILTDTCSVAHLLHTHGALSFWDYAAAAPYVEMEMHPRCTDHPDRWETSYKDAIFFSPHKFIGGPSTPGVLVVRRELCANRVPDVPGGGTVAYVNPVDHRYLADVEHREEGGTPAIVEAIRAGLVLDLKRSVGVDVIRAHEEYYLERVLDAWSAHPAIEILGNRDAHRLSIVSFVIRRPGGRYLHHNFVVALLNDLFGIQSRGGCSCAGPYGHRLLGIDLERSHLFETEITGGCEGLKPGWVRVNVNYFVSPRIVDYLIDAVSLVADHGWKLLPEYRLDLTRGRWVHRAGAVEPPLRLAQVRWTDGGLEYPRQRATAGEDALAGYLAQARELLEGLAPDPARWAECTSQSAAFEDLRWFELPAECLGPWPVADGGSREPVAAESV